eukprot:gene2372-2849_t
MAYVLEHLLGLSWLRLSESLSQFSHTIAAQTDLRAEAKHLYLFNKNFRGWKDVKFPTPFIATSAVLIESFERGVSVSEYTKLYRSSSPSHGLSSWSAVTGAVYKYLFLPGPPVAHAEPRGKQSEPSGRPTQSIPSVSPSNNQRKSWSKRELEEAVVAEATTSPAASSLPSKSQRVDPELAHYIIRRGEDLYLKMLLEDNLMHADLHPGNILFLHVDRQGAVIPPTFQSPADGALSDPHVPFRSTEAQLTMVDAGMVAVLEADERENFIGFLEALGEGDGRLAARFVLGFSVHTVGYSPQTVESFKVDMTELFRVTCRGYGTNVNVGEVLRGVLTLVRIHRIAIDVNYATLVMNVLCLDGLANELLPEYNILDAAKPLLRFHLLCKRTIGLTLFRALLPVARRIKKRMDGSYVQRLR